MNKQKKLDLKLKQRSDQLKLREELPETIDMKENLKKEITEKIQEREKLQQCTKEFMDDLEVKLNVAISEAAKWTDTMYMTMQYLK